MDGYFYSRTYLVTAGNMDPETEEDFEIPGREPDVVAVELIKRSSVDPFFMGLVARGKVDLSVLVNRRTEGNEHTLKRCAEFLESVQMHTCEGKYFLVLKFDFAIPSGIGAY